MTEHSHSRQRVDSVRVAIITVSDTRTEETDRSATLLRECLVAAGHSIAHYSIVPDEPTRVRRTIEELISDPNCDAIITNGGTGIAPRDTTIEAVDTLLDKHLPGFGELFRVLSFEQIGASAMLSRAIAGTANQTLVFVLPGSPGAVELALDRLILPTLAHAVWLLRSQRSGG